LSIPLSITDLQVRGDGGRTLLHVGQLQVSPGASVGIRGPSGAGKSTLLFALAGLTKQTTGQVQWDGADILTMNKRMQARFRRQQLGFVFQDFLLFDELTASANATIHTAFSAAGKRADIVSRASTLLTRFGLAADPKRSVASFSGGERQRVSVARALANDPAIILADEPTASLDRAAADRVIGDLLAAQGTGKTLLVVTHDEALLRRMDRNLTLVDGGVIVDDTLD